MRQKLITLDPTTFELASKKTNFSEWVRNMLRSERNKQGIRDEMIQLEKDCDKWYHMYMALAYPEGEEE